MFIFFRKLRKKLIDEGNLSRYILYGIGEIFLVVVGILIALQIDNWNDNRKDQLLAIDFLKGIQSDLNKDVELINQITQHEARAIALISSINPLFNDLIVDDFTSFSELIQPHNKDDMKHLFRRGTSFRAIRGTYNSLIADGKAGLIKNRELFGNLQLIYDEQHVRLNSIYDSIKELESHITKTYPIEKYQLTYEKLLESKDDKIFYELANLTEMKYLYSQWLILLRVDIQKLQVLLDQEISTLINQSK